MIDLNKWALAYRIAFLVAPFLILLSGLVILLRIASKRHFEVMCTSFRRSSGLYEEVKIWGASTLKSRLLVVSAMSVAALWPKLALRQGWLDPEDNQSFPVYLRRRMKLAFSLEFLGAGWLIAACMLIQFGML